jgi:NTE family protein
MSDDSFSWLQSDQIYVKRRRTGLNIAELLDLSDAQRELVIEITKNEPISLNNLIKALDRDPIELEIQINQMVAQGWLDIQEDESGEWVYRVRIGRRSKRILPPGIWQVLDDRWQVPIFRLFPESVLEEFSNSFQLQEHRTGTVLFEIGSWGERMYIVETGKIELLVYNEQKEPFVVREVGSGGTFGEIAALLGERRACAAHVVEETTVWALDKTSLDSLLAQHPAVGLTVRQELARHIKSPRRSDETKSQYNPIVVVGEGSSEFARHLADQASDQVVLIDLIGKRPEAMPTLQYVDASGMRSKVIAQAIQEKVESNDWVIVATLPEMTDQLMRVTGIAKVVIDMTRGSTPWLRAAARQYWDVPANTPLQMARMARKLCGRVTALVLSGGLARTIAHLGVLDVLQNAGIPIDLIASSGYGALWSVLYAIDRSPEKMIDMATSQGQKLRSFGGRLSLRAASRSGLFDARAVRNWIQNTVGTLTFSDLDIPCRLATSDLQTGEIVWMKSGRLFNALSACIATPGLVTPVEFQDHLLVDATLSNPLPIDAVAAEGADIIIASSVIPTPHARRKNAQKETKAQDLVTSWLGICEVIAHEHSLDHLSSVDLIIAPDISEFSDTAFDHMPALIERGRQAAEQILPRIQALLSNRRHK